MESHNRFEIKQQLGEGSFSKIYQAYDKYMKKDVALKVEKEDKHKKILKFEYEILRNLQGLPHIPKIYDFVENKTLNFIVMELLGKNVANHKKNKNNFNSLCAIDILIQMLNAIEALHDRGYIHRDIKPTNFVMGKQIPSEAKSESMVYMVDFGLAKLHLDKNSKPIPPRLNTDFRGTLTYASLNAHNKKELSRRDDLWSFFFVILDLLNETLPWRNCKDDKDDIKKVKEICLADPEKKLLLGSCKGKNEILEIFIYLKNLNYEDRPNYFYIKKKLEDLMMKESFKINFMNMFDFSNKGMDNNKEMDNMYELAKSVIHPGIGKLNNNFLQNYNIYDNQNNLNKMGNIFDNQFNNFYNFNTFNNNLMNVPNFNNYGNINMVNNINNFNLNCAEFIHKINFLQNQDLINNLTKKKRKREDQNEKAENVYDDIISRNNPKSYITKDTNQMINPHIPINTVGQNNQQNQIFIINQYNKSNISDIEKTLIDLLLPKKNLKNIPSNTNPSLNNIFNNQNNTTLENKKGYNINNNDKLLINNIKQKLKPIKQTENNTNNDILGKLFTSYEDNLNNFINNHNNNLFTINKSLLNSYENIYFNEISKQLNINDQPKNNIYDLYTNNFINNTKIKYNTAKLDKKIFKIEKQKKLK